MVDFDSGSQTSSQPAHHSEASPSSCSFEDIECRRYINNSGEVELWELTPLRSSLPSEVIYHEKCLLGQGTARGALRVVRHLKPTSAEALVFAKEQAIAIEEPKFECHFLQHRQILQYNGHQAPHAIPPLCLITEEFPLGDLQSHITANGPIREEEVRTIMRQVCNGLGLLHQEGLAHGDLQLRHIIIDRLPQSNSLGQHRSWRVKIGGRRLHYPANPTENESAEEFINAIAYNNLSFLPPEILSCYTLGRPLAFQTPLDIQSIDVWAAGEVAAQLLTGKPIFGLKTQKIMYYQEGTAHFPAWKLDVAMVSALGKRFIATFMHQDPLMRPTLPLDPRNEIAQWVEPANCWDAEQLKRIPLATLYHAKILPPTMHYTPDGSKLVVIDPQTITIRTSFAGFTSTWIYENDKHAAYRASALSSCGKRLAVYDANSNAIKLLDVTQIRNNETPVSYAVSERLFTHSQVVEWQQPLMILKFHPSDSTLLSASSNTFATLNLSVPANPASPVSYQPLEGTRRDPIINTCYTTNGLVLIICYENFTTYTWLQNGEVLFELEHPVPARVMAISPEGERLILGSYNGTIWSISLPLNPPRSEATYWVPVWRAVDRYPIDSIDIAPPSHEGATSAGVVTVAVVSGEKLTLLRIGDDQDDCCLGWVEYKKRKALLAKIKPRVEGESHLEIALWSGGESRITFLKFDKYFEKYEAYEASDEDDEDEDDEDTEEDDEGYDEDADSEEDSEEDSEKDDTYEEEDNEGQEGGFGGLGRKIRLVDGYRDVPPSHF